MLISRRDFERRLDHEFAQGRRSGYQLALVEVARTSGQAGLLGRDLHAIIRALQKLRPWEEVPDVVTNKRGEPT